MEGMFVGIVEGIYVGDNATIDHFAVTLMSMKNVTIRSWCLKRGDSILQFFVSMKRGNDFSR